MYLVVAFAALLGGLYLIYGMVKESEPEPTDQDPLKGLSEEAEESGHRVAGLSPLL